MIAEASDDRLLALLARHPRIEQARRVEGSALHFSQGPWRRRVLVAEPALEQAGLVELMDNNPLVCADEASVPDPVSTLALIGLGPLARAGLLVERPVILTSGEADEATLERFLERHGWPGGATVQSEDLELGETLAATVMAAIQTPEDPHEIDDLYTEAFGRSFFVRRDEESHWDTALIAGKPHAVFRLRLSEDHPTSLLTAQVMADRHGKCGAAQVVHCMNVMAGFEETLGIEG